MAIEITLLREDDEEKERDAQGDEASVSTTVSICPHR